MKYQPPVLLSSQGRQFYSFSLSDFLLINIVNFHGSGFEGSVEDQEVDITVKIRSDFLVPVQFPFRKVMDVLWPL